MNPPALLCGKKLGGSRRGVKSGSRAAAALCLVLAAALARADDTLSFAVADRAFGMSEGIPAAQVLSLYEDRAGALWAGTTAGLARLGGPDVRVFGLDDGLPRNVVYAVAEGGDGTLFVGTLGGIARFDGRRFVREPGVAGVERRVRSLVPDPEGRLYALVGRDTILRQTGASWEPLALPAKLVPDAIALAVDAHGEPWLATLNLGLLHLARDGASGLRLVERYAENEGFPGGECEFVTADGDGIAATSRRGVLRIGAGRRVELPYPAGFELGHAALARSRDGRLYLGAAAGVAEVGARAITPVRSSRGLSQAAVVRLLVDRSGNVWMGTVDRGVHVLFTGTGVSYMRVGGKDLRASECDADGFCWIATDRDLYRIAKDAGEGARPLRVRSEGIQPGPIFSFEDDGAGNLLLALEDGVGVLAQASRRGASPVLRRDPRFDKLGAVFVPRLVRDREGVIWAASRAGTWRLAPGAASLTPFALRERGSEPLSGLALDRSDALWLVDPEGALWRLHAAPERRAERLRLPGPAPGPIEEVAASPDGDLLVSFESGSWMLLEAGTGKLRARVDAGSELGRLAVLSVVRLGAGRYLAAHGGNRLSIVRLEPPRIESPVLVSSDLDDADFRYLSAHSLDGGRYALATLGAVARLQGLRAPPAPPVLGLAGLRVENPDPDALPGTVSLAPRPNAVDVLLSLAEPVAPRQVRYRWRLLGESELWSQWSSDPRVRLSNLEAGRFTLEAEARDRYGRPAPLPLRVALAAAPLYWETWPFRTALVLLAVSLGYSGYRRRVRAILRDRERLESAVAERSAELARANRELQEASLTDPLTGLRNRRFFAAIIADEEGRARRAWKTRAGETRPASPDLIFYSVDLDHFKSINDTYGHAVGDRVLVEAARRLRSVVRQADIVIRWGGEEFLVVSREARREEGERLAARILKAVGTAPFELGEGRAAQRTCSVGWAAFPEDPRAPDAADHGEALKRADAALYEAKASGRNAALGLLLAEDGSLARVASAGPEQIR